LLGRLKWTPETFYTATYEDSIDAINGHLEEKADDERIARRLGLMAISPYIKEDFDIYKHWPIVGDDQTKRQSLLQRLRDHKLKEQQKKMNGS
jgi:hypothetical protein